MFHVHHLLFKCSLNLLKSAQNNTEDESSSLLDHALIVYVNPPNFDCSIFVNPSLRHRRHPVLSVKVATVSKTNVDFNFLLRPTA